MEENGKGNVEDALDAVAVLVDKTRRSWLPWRRLEFLAAAQVVLLSTLINQREEEKEQGVGAAAGAIREALAAAGLTEDSGPASVQVINRETGEAMRFSRDGQQTPVDPRLTCGCPRCVAWRVTQGVTIAPGSTGGLGS